MFKYPWFFAGIQEQIALYGTTLFIVLNSGELLRLVSYFRKKTVNVSIKDAGILFLIFNNFGYGSCSAGDCQQNNCFFIIFIVFFSQVIRQIRSTEEGVLADVFLLLK